METQKIDTLQQVINQRAEARLDRDMIEISDYIRGNRILANTEIPNLTYELYPKEDGKINLQKHPPFWVFQYEKRTSSSYISRSVYMDRLRDYWLPIYIQEETNLFVSKIDELGEQVENLQNEIDNLPRE